jgi:hypothetical protein
VKAAFVVFVVGEREGPIEDGSLSKILLRNSAVERPRNKRPWSGRRSAFEAARIVTEGRTMRNPSAGLGGGSRPAPEIFVVPGNGPEPGPTTFSVHRKKAR